jgi:hypothetical protein
MPGGRRSNANQRAALDVGQLRHVNQATAAAIDALHVERGLEQLK